MDLGDAMTSAVTKIVLAGSLSLAGVPAFAGADMETEARIEAAFAAALEARSTDGFASVRCVQNQPQIAVANGAELLFPCELQELVEDRFDASMLVTLLLAEPRSAAPEFETETDAAETAAAAGLAIVGALADPGSDREAIERARGNIGVASPGLGAYAPAGSRAITLEASRLKREVEALGPPSRKDERARRMAAANREEEDARRAEYAAVTAFLELANAQGFCPADGRTFLIRASEYATSPVQEDRIYGLWADDRRHALEPYLNDLSRCR